MIVLMVILIFCVEFFVSRRSKKWNEMGLRYAKYATDGGIENHAEKAAQSIAMTAIKVFVFIRIIIICYGYRLKHVHQLSIL